MTIKTLFQKVELEVEKRFPTLAKKVRVRFFNDDGTIFSQGGDAVPSDDPADIIAINVMPLSPEEDAEIREAHRVGV